MTPKVATSDPLICCLISFSKVKENVYGNCYLVFVQKIYWCLFTKLKKNPDDTLSLCLVSISISSLDNVSVSLGAVWTTTLSPGTAGTSSFRIIIDVSIGRDLLLEGHSKNSTVPVSIFGIEYQYSYQISMLYSC